MSEHEEYMDIAISQAKIGAKYDEVPIGAVVVLNGKVIAKAYNKKNRKNNPLYHAEIIVIDKAIKKLKDWHLNDCTLYTTLEPCPMCCGYILNSRIGTVVFGASDKKFGCAGTIYNLLDEKRFNHTCKIIGGVKEKECGEILSTFFKTKR